MPAKNVRELVVKAVSSVIARDGLANTTIDAVSREAGVSKGGVLHYFANKQDLFLAMVGDFERRFYERRDAVALTLPERKNRLLKATVISMLDNLNATADKGFNIAVVLDDETLASAVRQFKRKALKAGGQGYPPEKIALVMYLIDGLWLDSRFTPPVIAKKTRNAVIKELYAIIDAM